MIAHPPVAAPPEAPHATLDVLLVDGHALFRRGLRDLLVDAGINVVEDVGSGEAALRALGRLAPDVVVTDLALPGLDGPETIRRIIALAPQTRVLVLSAGDADDAVIEAIVAGAHGYLLKDAPVSEVVAAVHAARAGQSILSPAIAARLLGRIRRLDPRRAERAPVPGELTSREAEVLQLLADGLENADIARELYISQSTVKNHVANILAKLQMHNRIQAAVYAVKHGLA